MVVTWAEPLIRRNPSTSLPSKSRPGNNPGGKKHAMFHSAANQMSLTSWRNPELAEESRFVHSMTRLILKQNK